MKCIYCNKEKDDTEFSLEHIFPTSLGGKKLNNNLFKTRNVCKTCNSKMGLNVDALFLKSFFVKIGLSNDHLNYIDFNDDKSLLPFIYLGQSNLVKHPEYEYCDYWTAVNGSTIYHYHNNYSEDFESLAGGNPIKQKNKKTSGEAYLFIRTDNPIWIKKLLFSFKGQFKYTNRFGVNLNITNENDLLFIPNEEQKEIIKLILEKANNTQKNRSVFKEGFETRFLAKIGLAIGYNLFGDDYLESENAIIFQKVIWEKDIDKIRKLNPKMSNFFNMIGNKQDDIIKFISWKGGNTIYFFHSDNKLTLYVSLFGSAIPLVVNISEELNKYKNVLLEKYPNGWVYIFVPQRNILKGEYGIPEYIAYMTGDTTFMEDLTDLENLYIDEKDLPPFILNKLLLNG